MMNAKDKIDEIASLLEKNYKDQGLFENDIDAKIPSREEIIYIINEVKRVVFPGFFGKENTAYVTLKNFAGNTLAGIYEKLFRQIKVALKYQAKMTGENEDLSNIDSKVEKIVLEFIDSLPAIQELIIKDVQAEFDGDPAAFSKQEIIFSYPGIYAIFVYRIAHVLYGLNVPFIPRIMTEQAHSKTGIDINPGATIGEYFFIDHGTGIVIGETTVIGDHVKIYQGVTLGALSTVKGQQLSGVKRHPTIEDGVVIYANTTILGGDTVIGKNSVIAGNTFVTQSVPENTRVFALAPELTMQKREKKSN